MGHIYKLKNIVMFLSYKWFIKLACCLKICDKTISWENHADLYFPELDNIMVREALVTRTEQTKLLGMIFNSHLKLSFGVVQDWWRNSIFQIEVNKPVDRIIGALEVQSISSITYMSPDSHKKLAVINTTSSCNNTQKDLFATF